MSFMPTASGLASSNPLRTSSSDALGALWRVSRSLAVAGCLTVLPVVLAFHLLNLWNWDFSVPLVYGAPGADEIWQLIATKTVLDTGWVLTNPFLGAPDISTWYGNSGSQTSALHSVLMLGIGLFIEDAVRVQQVYFLLCCSLITANTYLACRLVGCRRLPSVAAGLVLCFASYRLHALFFAYLANYIMVPLAIVPPLWVLQAKFAPRELWNAGGAVSPWLVVQATLLSRRFAIALAIVVLTAVSDGYYAFFSLLLLGFAAGLRLLFGDLRRPARLLAPCVLVFCTFATVTALSYPIQEYRRTHPTQADQDQMKAPTDAEVYSPSLKLLVAPLVDHRIPALASIGAYIVETANFNRKFPYARGAPVTLGTFGAVIFAAILAYWLATSSTRRLATVAGTCGDDGRRSPSLPVAMAMFGVFVLLFSIGGGLGSLIALVFPSIRAYERFPIFLLAIIYLTAAYAVTRLLDRLSGGGRLLIRAAVVSCAWLIIMDQVPKDLLGLSTAAGFESRSTRFLAERRFVQKLEASLSTGAMVYQHPYSQYLTNNKFYGWGAFGQLRLYLHSKSLRWSNGGAKGAPGENWHERMAGLPVDRMLDEMQAVGFRAVVADRLVLPDGDYLPFKELMKRRTGLDPVENETAKLAYWPLAAVPYRIEYEPDYETVARLTVDHRFDPAGYGLPRLVNGAALSAFLSSYGGSYPLVLNRADHPGLFVFGDERDRGFGQEKIAPITDMKGDLLCEAANRRDELTPQDTMSLSINNRTAFDWKFGSGTFPLQVGVHYFDAKGMQQKEEINLPYEGYVEAGKMTTIDVPLQTILSPALSSGLTEVTAKLSLVQSGHAWFSQPGNTECSVRIRRG